MLKLNDIITVVNIIDEDDGTVRCTKCTGVHLEKTNQVAVSGSNLINQDVVSVYYGIKNRSKASRELISEVDFTANPLDEGTFTFRKGDFIIQGDIQVLSVEELNTRKQKCGDVYEIISVAQHTFGNLPNIQLTCK